MNLDENERQNISRVCVSFKAVSIVVILVGAALIGVLADSRLRGNTRIRSRTKDTFSFKEAGVIRNAEESPITLDYCKWFG